MLESPHVIVAAVIATKITNPLISLPLAFGSHFVLDRVPHWNPHLNTEIKQYGKVSRRSTIIVVLDVLLGLGAGLWMAGNVLPNTNHAIIILLASFAGVLPDVVEGPYFFLNMKHKLITGWIKFQKSIQVDTTIVPGIFTQIITVIAAITWSLN